MVDETHAVVKIAVFLGLIFLIVGLLYPAQTQWATFTSTVQDFPAFVNPFDQSAVQRYTSVPEGPTVLTAGAPANVSFVGCANTTNGRQHCLNTDDGEESYMRAVFEGPSQFSSVILDFNLSYPNTPDIDGSAIRRYIWTMRCRTLNGGALPVVFVGAGGNITTQDQTCPAGNHFVNVIRDRSTPNGVLNLDWSGANEAGIELFGQLGFETYFGTVDVSYIRLEIVIGEEAATTGCQAPEGAWFPWADEIACAIGQFGQIVWKFILFIVNAAIFIGQIIIWIGAVIISFVSIIAFFLALPDAPPLVQSIITVIMIGSLLFIVIVAFRNIRGSGIGV